MSGNNSNYSTETAPSLMLEATDTLTNPFAVFELSLDASSDIAGLATAISALSSAVEEVRVDIYNSFTTRWHQEGVAELFEALGQVPSLLKIEFYGLRIFPYRMPISMAERTLARATKLQEFSLVGINLSADSWAEAPPNQQPNPAQEPNQQQEFAQFSKTLRQHPSLKVFGLDNCRLTDEATGPTLDDAIVSPLVDGCPTLERLVIRAMEVTMWGTVSCASVARLCKSTTLKSLELFVFSNCGSSFLAEMARALIQTSQRSQLHDISISGCLGGLEGAKIISKMIQLNTPLKSLELHLRSRSGLDDEAGIMELSKALTKNKTLTKFQLHAATNSGGSVDARKAFLQMMETNYTLLEGVQVFHPGFLRPENELYLRLNQVGRGRLLENTNVGREAWVDTLVSVRDDLDCLYYLLNTNPSLCYSTSNGASSGKDGSSVLQCKALSSSSSSSFFKEEMGISIQGEDFLDTVNRKRKRHFEATVSATKESSSSRAVTI